MVKIKRSEYNSKEWEWIHVFSSSNSSLCSSLSIFSLSKPHRAEIYKERMERKQSAFEDLSFHSYFLIPIQLTLLLLSFLIHQIQDPFLVVGSFKLIFKKKIKF